MNTQISTQLSSLNKQDDVDEVTVLFVSSLWLWLLGDELGAKATMDASLHVHSLNVAFASDFRS